MASATPPVRRRPLGLSAAAFKAVITAAGGLAALVGKTTGWLKYEHVKPATAAAASSYVDLLRARPDGDALVGDATVFLSHAYGYAFLDVVYAVAAWAGRNPREDGCAHFFYFDLFVVNQHGQGAVVPFETLRDEYAGGIRSIDRTLLLLDFSNPIALTSAWCAFEAATTLACGAQFDVIMAPRSAAAFETALIEDFESLALKTCTIDVENSTAREKDDLINIKRVIVDDMGGFLAVNMLVTSALHKWMAARGHEALRKLPASERAVSALQHSLATLLKEQGQYAKADELLCESVAAHRKMGNLRVNTLVALDTLATVRRRQGNYAAAEELYREAHAGMVAMLPNDARTFAILGNLATVLNFQGRFVEAEPLYRDELEGERKLLGPAHPQTLKTLTNYAGVLLELRKYDDAEPLIIDTVASLSAVLGDAHPTTITSSIIHARFLHSKGMDVEAERLLRKGLMNARKNLGDVHPDTLSSLDNLATFFYTTNRHDESEQKYREALTGMRDVLGAAHPKTLQVASNFALLLSDRASQVCKNGGETGYAEAEIILRQSLKLKREFLGGTHASTLNTLGNLSLVLGQRAGLLKDIGKLTEAEPLYREALAGMRDARVAIDPTTLFVTLGNFANLLKEQRNFAEAEPLCREAIAGNRGVRDDAMQTSTLHSILTLANILSDRDEGKNAEAVLLYREAIAGMRMALPGTDPLLLAAVNSFGSTMFAQRQFVEAERLFRDALTGRLATLGPAHPLTRKSSTSLAAALFALGRVAEAEATLASASITHVRAEHT